MTQGALGDVSITPDGQRVGTAPHLNANGIDTFTYLVDDHAGSTESLIVRMHIDPRNDAPVAGLDAVSVPRNGPATAVDVLGNDTDVESDSITVTDASDPVKGSVVVTGGGTGLTYQPDPDGTGSNSFTYTVADGHGGSATGTVNVTIIGTNSAPVAAADSKIVPEDAIATPIEVLTNDSDADSGDTRTITAKTNGAKGDVVIAGGGYRLHVQAEAQPERVRQLHLYDLGRPWRVRDGHSLRDHHPGQR